MQCIDRFQLGVRDKTFLAACKEYLNTVDKKIMKFEAEINGGVNDEGARSSSYLKVSYCLNSQKGKPHRSHNRPGSQNEERPEV